MGFYAEIMDDDEEPVAEDSKGLSDDSKIPEDTPLDSATTPKSHIEASPAASDSS